MTPWDSHVPFLTESKVSHAALAWVQAEYAVLQKKYRAIKQQRMEELEALMTEQQQRVNAFQLCT